MQFISHNDKDATVLVYHTNPHLSGTDQFECSARVKVADLEYGQDPRPQKLGNGKTVLYPIENPNILTVKCPNCDSVASVPVSGGSEAQKLHVAHRLHSDKHPAKSHAEAIESVLVDVVKAGGMPSVELILEGVGYAGKDLKKHPKLQELTAQLFVTDKP